MYVCMYGFYEGTPPPETQGPLFEMDTTELILAPLQGDSKGDKLNAIFLAGKAPAARLALKNCAYIKKTLATLRLLRNVMCSVYPINQLTKPK